MARLHPLLTNREIECLEDYARLGKAKIVAAEQYCSPSTVEFHLHNARKKLGVNKSLKAIREAARLGALSLRRFEI